MKLFIFLLILLKYNTNFKLINGINIYNTLNLFYLGTNGNNWINKIGWQQNQTS